MRAIIVFLAANLLWLGSALAESQQPTTFPMLGFVKKDLLYVPTYRDKRGKIPKQLYAYGGGKEFIAKLREKDSYETSCRGGDCDDHIKGYFLYKVPPSLERVNVVIFDKRKNIQFEKNKLIEQASQTEWEIFNLTSQEGVHDILRTKRKGKCVSHVDYYTYCRYATEADSEEVFLSAMCGIQIDGLETGF